MSKYEKLPTFISNAEIEKKEWILNPDLRSFEAGGNYHSNKGTPVLLPEGAKIFSRIIKLEPELVSNLVGKEKSMSPAQMAKMYPTMPFIKTLVDDDSNSVEKNTAKIMLAKNINTQNAIFDAQEQSKAQKSTDTLNNLLGILDNPKMAMGGKTFKFAFGGKKLSDPPFTDPPISDADYALGLSNQSNNNPNMSDADYALGLANQSNNNPNQSNNNPNISDADYALGLAPQLTKNDNSYLNYNAATQKSNAYSLNNQLKPNATANVATPSSTTRTMGQDPIQNANYANQFRNILDLATLREQPPAYNYVSQSPAYTRYNPINTLANERALNMSREELQNSNLPQQAKAAYSSDYLAKTLDSIGQNSVQNQQGNINNQNQNSELYNNVTNQNRQQKIAYDDRFEELRQKMLSNKNQAKESIMNNLLGVNSKMAQDQVNLNLVNKLGQNYYFDGKNIQYLPGQGSRSFVSPLQQYTQDSKQQLIKKLTDQLDNGTMNYRAYPILEKLLENK